MALEEFKTQLDQLTEEYKGLKNEPGLSIFNVAPNAQLLQDFIAKVDKVYKKSVERNPELEEEMITVSSDSIVEMTGIMLVEE